MAYEPDVTNIMHCTQRLFYVVWCVFCWKYW